MNPHLAEDTDDENCDDPIRLFDNDLRAAVYFGSTPLGHSTCRLKAMPSQGKICHSRENSTLGNPDSVQVENIQSDTTSTCRYTENRWRLEAIGNVEFCHSRENSILGNPDGDQVKKIKSGTTSECNIIPLSVKLVDCGKFPWYFRKYTQQIMHKINLNQHSDSDEDLDVEVVEDSDDCFIIEDLQDAITNKIIKNDQLCIKTVKSPGPKSKTHKNKLHGPLQIIKRRRGDEEIRRALSVKHLVQVDLKRNQGLVGMKIVQRVETNETLDIADRKNVVEKAEVKEQSVVANEKYVTAADKALSHISTQLIPIIGEKESNGTQLIPIIGEKESNSICQFTVTDEENDLVGKPSLVKSPRSQNITVQFDISKISNELIDNLKVISQSNKSLFKNPEYKIETKNDKKLSSKLTIPEKIENSSTKVTSNVKDVKNTNRYKNNQHKINSISGHSSLVGLLVTNKSKEDIKEMKCKKQKRHKIGKQSLSNKVVKKPRKKIEKQKPELKSPILHCSTMTKKPKYEMPSKCDKSDTNFNLSKELNKLTKIVDELTNSKSCNSVQDTNRPKPIIFPRVTPKPFDVHTKQAIRRDSNEIPDKTKSQSRNINLKSLNVSDKLPKNCNDVKKFDFKANNFRNTQIMSQSLNKAVDEQNVLRETHPNNVNMRTKNTIAVTNPNPKAPIKTNKPTVCNSDVPTTTVAAPASGSDSIPVIQYSNFPISHGPHFPIHNAVQNKMSNSNIPRKHVNMSVQNRYASAIILKSNNQPNFPFEKYCEPPVRTVAPQRPMTVLTHSQPQCRERPPPPPPIFYPPAPSVTHQGYDPSSVNSVPNQLHYPQGHIGQQPSNPMQDFYRKCWLPQNMAPPPPPPPPIIPPPPPIIPPPYVPPRNGHNVNQSNDCPNLNRPSASLVQNPQSGSQQNIVNTVQGNNSSIIGINNDGLVKKINIAAMPVQNNNVNNIIETIKVEQVKDLQIMSTVEDTEVVTTRNEMLKELDKLSFVDGNSFKEMSPASIINENKKENTLDVAIMSNKPGRFETLKLTMNSKDKPVQTQLKGYSPPILPIPTYQKVLHRVNVNPLTKNTRPKIDPRPGDPKANMKIETKPMRIRDFVKCCKRKFNNAWSNDEDSKRKEEAKKISLEEYKKRLMKNDSKSENNKNVFVDKLKNRKNVDYSTETDLGYDSDSTVVL